jgi:hypothetical protein
MSTNSAEPIPQPETLLKPETLKPETLFPSAPALIALLVFWMALLYGPRMMNMDGDLGRHLTIGRVILESGRIPTRDLFSHTMAGEPLVPHEWLSQVLFALVHRLAGLDGVVWLTAAVLAAAYGLLTAGMRSAGVRAPVPLFAGLIAAVVGSLHWLTRPHIFTLLLFAAFIVLLERYRREGRLRLLFPLLPLMALWANLHGAFISGLVLVAVYAAGAALERRRKAALLLWGLLAGLVLASALNPVGFRLLPHSFQYLGQRFLVDITQEYQSPDFHNVGTWPFAALLLGSLALGWLARRRLAWTPLLLLAVWSAMALYSARNIPLYALVAVPILARAVDEEVREGWPALSVRFSRLEQVERRAWGWLWTAAAVIIGVALEATGTPLDALQAGNRFDPQVFPVQAIDSLGGLPEGPVFNELFWGGYLLYRDWPHTRVFIDGQTDFYGEPLSREYWQVLQGQEGWAEVLERYDVRWVILPPSRPLAAALDASPGWQRLYADETAVIWQRR